MKSNFRKSMFLILLMIFSWVTSGKSSEQYNIGLLIDGEWQNENLLLEGIKREILELTQGEFDVRFPEQKMLHGDWSKASVIQKLDQLLNDPDVDMIITLGIIGCHEITQRGPLPIPVIAPYILDSEFQNPPVTARGVSGVQNLSYIVVPSNFKRDMEFFREIIEFKNIGIVISEYDMECLDPSGRKLKSQFNDYGLNATVIPLKNDVESALLDIDESIEAIYLLPLPALSDKDYRMLIQGLIERDLPSFSYVGEERVRMGILAGLNREVLTRTSRRVALNMQRIFLGEEAMNIPVSISLDKQLTINEETADLINISPPWAVVTEANMVGEKPDEDKIEYDIFEVVDEALKVNLDMKAKDYYILSGKQDINAARSNLLPTIEANGNYIIVDEDLANASLGQQAERTTSGSLTATQVLFSEPAWANMSIQRKLHESRLKESEQLKLDIIQDAATAYLNILRAKTFEKIQQENLHLTRKNYELAQIREIIGSAGPAEVFRWESQIATNRKEVIEANSQRNLVEMQLNRILNRPIEESFDIVDVDLKDPVFITANDDIFKFIENRKAFKLFRRFMVEETFKNSPELASFDAAIEAQRRALTSSNFSFFSPTLAAQGQYNKTFSREGAGTNGIELPAAFAQFGDIFPELKDENWTIGLNLSFPLFRGGDKFAQQQKNSKKLTQLLIEREALAQQLEQRVRSALHIAGASNASIKQTRLASEAAQKSLQVVQDAYSQGMVTIIELLDAQNAALITDLAAANSIYDFLIDLMEVERAYGGFNFYSNTELRQQFFARVYEFFENNGLQLR